MSQCISDVSAAATELLRGRKLRPQEQARGPTERGNTDSDGPGVARPKSPATLAAEYEEARQQQNDIDCMRADEVGLLNPSALRPVFSEARAATDLATSVPIAEPEQLPVVVGRPLQPEEQAQRGRRRVQYYDGSDGSPHHAVIICGVEYRGYPSRVAAVVASMTPPPRLSLLPASQVAQPAALPVAHARLLEPQEQARGPSERGNTDQDGPSWNHGRTPVLNTTSSTRRVRLAADNASLTTKTQVCRWEYVRPNEGLHGQQLSNWICGFAPSVHKEEV